MKNGFKALAKIKRFWISLLRTHLINSDNWRSRIKTYSYLWICFVLYILMMYCAGTSKIVQVGWHVSWADLMIVTDNLIVTTVTNRNRHFHSDLRKPSHLILQVKNTSKAQFINWNFSPLAGSYSASDLCLIF